MDIHRTYSIAGRGYGIFAAVAVTLLALSLALSHAAGAVAAHSARENTCHVHGWRFVSSTVSCRKARRLIRRADPLLAKAPVGPVGTEQNARVGAWRCHRFTNEGATSGGVIVSNDCKASGGRRVTWDR